MNKLLKDRKFRIYSLMITLAVLLIAFGLLLLIYHNTNDNSNNSNYTSQNNSSVAGKLIPTKIPLTPTTVYNNSLYSYTVSVPPLYALYKELNGGSPVEFKDIYLTADALETGDFKALISIACSNTTPTSSNVEDWISQNLYNNTMVGKSESQANITVGVNKYMQVKSLIYTGLSGNHEVLDSIINPKQGLACDIQNSENVTGYKVTGSNEYNVFLSSFKLL